MDKAPLGHFCTCSTIFSEEAASILIQGTSFGLKTSERPRAQNPECVHFVGSQMTVISPLEYSFFMLAKNLRNRYQFD